jgi:hypothetical protein
MNKVDSWHEAGRRNGESYKCIVYSIISRPLNNCGKGINIYVT